MEEGNEEAKWPYYNCAEVFDKYIEAAPQSSVDLPDVIEDVFRDISQQFEFEEYEDLLKEAKQNLPQEQQVPKDVFEGMICEWINLFREEVTSNLISE